MSPLARIERAALCDLALELGPDAPTLSGDWTVKELVVHLLVREGSPAAIGIVVPPLARVTELASARVARGDLPELVERLRQGPPIYSPFRFAAVDKVLNTMEFFVHHEDIRRAQDGWGPRDLSGRAESVLWKLLRVSGKGLVRSAPVGITVERIDTSQSATLKVGASRVVVRGLPSELVLFAYGRRDHARVKVAGEPADVARLTGADPGSQP
jgi:uncharacterized protein (TIGR03085 family)